MRVDDMVARGEVQQPAIPPPPDGSGIAEGGAPQSSDVVSIPPPPDGSGISKSGVVFEGIPQPPDGSGITDIEPESAGRERVLKQRADAGLSALPRDPSTPDYVVDLANRLTDLPATKAAADFAAKKMRFFSDADKNALLTTVHDMAINKSKYSGMGVAGRAVAATGAGAADFGRMIEKVTGNGPRELDSDFAKKLYEVQAFADPVNNPNKPWYERGLVGASEMAVPLAAGGAAAGVAKAAAGTLGATAAVAGRIGGATGASTFAPELYEEAYNQGIDNKLSPAVASAAATVSAALQSALFAGIVHGLVPKGIGEAASKTVIGAVTKSYAKSVASGTGLMAASSAAGEAIQQIAAGNPDLQKLLTKGLEGAKQGAETMPFLAAPGAAVQAGVGLKIRSEQNKIRSEVGAKYADMVVTWADSETREAIIAKAKSGVAPTRTEWKEWGFPAEEKLGGRDRLARIKGAVDAYEARQNLPDEKTTEEQPATEQPAPEQQQSIEQKPIEQATMLGVEPPKTDVLPLSEEGGIPAEKIAKKMKSFFQSKFTSRGDLPEQAFKAKLQIEHDVNSEIHKLRFIAKDYKVALKETLGGKVPSEQDIASINAVLDGKATLDSLPDKLQAPIREMRDHIDALTAKGVASGALSGDLAVKATANKGVYVTRSYEIFENPKYDVEKIPEPIKNKAAAYLRQEFPNYPQEKLQGMFDALLMKGEESKTPLTLMKNAKLGAMNRGILKDLSNVPEPIQDLWGVRKDPALRYATTVFKQATLFANYDFLERVRKDGMNKYLFDEPISNDSGKFVAKISADSNKSMAPLAGMYTTPEIKNAFDTMYARDMMPNYLRFYMKINAISKYSKTVESYQSEVRNLTSNLGFMLANGHFDVKQMPKAWNALKADLTSTGDAKARAYSAELAKYGISDESVSAGELRDVASDAGMNIEDMIYNSSERSTKRIQRYAGKTVRVMNKAYQAGDLLPKIYAWENEKARYQEAYPSWSDDKVKQHCADIVRNTYPTYSMVPQSVKWLRRLPMSGFVNFSAEVIRTTFNTLELAAKEVKDPATRKIGMKRFAGTFLAITGNHAMSYATKLAVGVSPQDEKDLRWFVAPYQKNSSFLYMSRNQGGLFSFIDLGFSDPHSNIIEPITAYMRGKDIKESTISSMAAIVKPFTTEGILSKAMTEVWTNHKPSGEVYNEQDSAGEQAKAIFLHLWKTVEPGTVTSLTRIGKGLLGKANNSGQPISAGTEAAALMAGQRIQDLDVATNLKWKLREAKRKIEKAGDILDYATSRKGNVGTGEVDSAYNRANARSEELFSEASEMVRSSIRLGVKPGDAYETLRECGFTEQQRSAIIDGGYVPILLSDQRKRAILRANPSEAARRIGEFSGAIDKEIKEKALAKQK
jgi:hypothetical protein